MARVYRWMLTASGIAWLSIAPWNSPWLQPLVVAAGLALILVGWRPVGHRARHITAYLAAVSGLLQLLDGSVWNPHDPVWIRPGMVAGLVLVLYTVMLVAFGHVAARGSDV